jgi:hypothetical protein
VGILLQVVDQVPLVGEKQPALADGHMSHLWSDHVVRRLSSVELPNLREGQKKRL